MKVNGEKDLTDSPCVGICSATALGDEICIGCGRSFDEVRLWITFSDEEKMKINQRLQNQNSSKIQE
jgi:uncharacterized protein